VETGGKSNQQDEQNSFNNAHDLSLSLSLSSPTARSGLCWPCVG
jgi:hypothetical protein